MEVSGQLDAPTSLPPDTLYVFCINNFYMNIFLISERIIRVSIISYGEIRLDIRVLWITSTFPERIMLANHCISKSSYPMGNGGFFPWGKTARA
jgi:hypothetical protein